ncbi:hypothetical protein GYH30_011188 [Glycine max]|uniref:Uncharacterized protein n=1 Tax=Glycine max TaxID=3847 RepID=A0A0R0JPC3_SOYBN|nr:hypothetical protein GYH30_011188 [Glycine max]
MRPKYNSKNRPSCVVSVGFPCPEPCRRFFKKKTGHNKYVSDTCLCRQRVKNGNTTVWGCASTSHLAVQSC